ncbi:caspase family protein [Streptomyces canus]|uniref:caspase, EACC1-associated type n=1 Tax=Streptomyces canus TaxID=58343 RepID=UPI002E2A65A8|nr:caspase family protein [Streptomyces canus]
MARLPDPNRSRAVLIGCSKAAPDGGLHPLPAVAGNISGLRDLLTSALWRLPDDRCTVLLDPVSPREVSQAVKDAAEDATDAVLVYYAGHGVLDSGSGRLHLALPDSWSTSAYDTCLPYEWVRVPLQRSPAARRIVILDCCFAARAFETQSASVAELAETDGTYVLAAAGETAVALAPKGEQHTAFTGELLTLLGTGVPGAPAFLTLDEVFRRLRERLLAKGRPQPHSLCRNQVGQEPFAPNAAHVPEAAVSAVDPDRLLAGLHMAQRRAAREAPYKLFGARRPALSQVYVRRQLVSPEELGTAAHGLGGEPSGTRARGLARPVEAALKRHEHLLIVAGPGLGKSTLTLQLAAGERVERIPLRVPARELAARRTLPWPRAVAEAAAVDLGQRLDAGLPEELLSGERKWLLLVDGLDEIPDPEARAELAEVLAARMGAPGDGPHRLLITTRALSSAELGVLRGRFTGEYTVEPFDREALERFARAWFAADAALAERFLDQLDEARLTDVVKVPLLATVAAVVFEEAPHRPLPQGRYALYEEFLGCLHAHWGARKWAELRERADDLDGGAQALELLRARHRELLAHLARVRLETEDPLLREAMAWVATQGAAPRGSAARWREIVATALTGPGPLVRHGSDVQFLHQSFAEHCAAAAYAEELPERFDPVDPRWERWLGQALWGEEGLGHAVLLTYARLRPDSGMLGALQQHTEECRLYAGRLLADGVPDPGGALEGFLADARRWLAVDSGIPLADHLVDGDDVGEILERLDAGVVAAELVPLAEGPARRGRWLVANTVLARLGPPWADAAIERLSRAAASPAMDGYIRSTCAETLAKMTPEARRQAAETFADLMWREPFEHVFLRCNSAAALSRLVPESRKEAERCLRSVASEAIGLNDLELVVGIFTELGLTIPPEAVARMRAVLQAGPQQDCHYEYYRIASTLAEAVPEHGAEVVATLRRLLSSDTRQTRDLHLVCRTLVQLGDEFVPECAAALRALASDEGRSLVSRAEAAECLASLKPVYTDEGIALLWSVLAQAEWAGWELVSCLDTMMTLAPRMRDQAVGLLRRWIAAGGLFTAGTVAGGSFGTPPKRPDGQSRSLTVWDALRAVRALARMGPQWRTEAAEVLRGALASGSLRAFEQVYVLRQLVGLGPEYLHETMEHCRAMTRRADLSSSDRRSAAQILASAGAAELAEVVPVLRELAVSSPHEHDRIAAAEQLADLGPEWHEEGMALAERVRESVRVGGQADGTEFPG